MFHHAAAPLFPARTPSACRWLLLTAALGSFFLAGPAGAAVFTVGGAGCTHADLFSALVTAINTAGADEIRLLANTTHQGQFLVNSGDGLSIRGGFASCAATTPTGMSTLKGDNSNRALFLIVNGVTLLERLTINGGSVTGNGGGLFVQGGARVDLSLVHLVGNTATSKGGNVYVSASPGLEVRFLAGSIVSAGQAPDGGGIACSGAGGVLLHFDAAVANNTATNNGGGVWLGGDCVLFSNAGGAVGGIRGNLGINNGGGVYVESSAEFNTGLAEGGPTVIEGNTANNGGGGVFVTGTGSVIRLFSARTSLNHAGGAGGGFFADDSAVAVVARPVTDPDPCPDPVRCSQLFANSASVGGAIYSDDLAQVNVHGTHIESNSSTLFNPVASVRGGSVATIHSSVIAGNSGSELMLVSDAGSSLVLGNVTVANNINIGDGIIEVVTNTVGPVRVLSSVFSQAGPLFVPGFPAGITPQVDCVMSAQGGLFNAMPVGTVVRSIAVSDPQLGNPAAGNYMLRGTSPAIDACDTTQWNGGAQDLDWQARDIDNPDHPNPLPGFRDLGADEHSVMFADGFESGNMNRWTTVVQ